MFVSAKRRKKYLVQVPYVTQYKRNFNPKKNFSSLEN